MKKYIPLIALALLAFVAVILAISGCSVIGFTIGAISDASKPDTITVPGWELELVETGRPIRVTLKNGDWVEGRFAGIAHLPEAEYVKTYGTFRDENLDELILPAWGDTIIITMKNQVEGHRQFLGFDYYYAQVREETKAISELGAGAHVVYVSVVDDTVTGQVLVSEIEKITDKGRNQLKGEDLRWFLAQGQTPLLSAITVEGLTDTTHIPMDQVLQIEVKTKKTGAKTGFLAGAFLDVIIIAVALVSGDSEPKQTTQGDGDIMCGCPFVYSYDGEKYVLDSEAFGGSIFKAAKRTDLGRLDNLREIDGICRLKIVDELQETDYMDEVKLLVVDHPKGSEVISSLSCQLYTLSDLQAPVSAFDWRGNDVIDLIREKDDRFWVSNPFGRNPDIKVHARDGLDLKFSRPAHAAFVKLAFNVQNTLWAAHLQSRFLELHGDQLEGWYHLMNTSAQARQEFQQVMIREGMLLIKLWNGEDWQTFDFVWEVGASVFRDQVVWLDISQIPGEELKVSLECPSGFWMVNSVHADYTPDLPLEIAEVPLSTAKDHLGRDLEQILQNTDDVYHLMLTGDWSELTFAVPPQRKGLSRTFLLKSSGYYTINVVAEGQPQVDLIEQFMTEPFAFGQYALQLLNGYMASAFLSSLEQKPDMPPR